MEKGRKHRKMSHVPNTEEERHLPRQAVLAGAGESVESDTESLAQERAYHHLQMRIGQYDQIKVMSQKENADNLQQGGKQGGKEDSSEDELEMYDSLEVSVHPQTKTNSNQLHGEYLEAPTEEKQRASRLLADDAYSDLRYDPNWRNNLKGAGRFDESPKISVDEHYQDLTESSGRPCGDREGRAGKAACFIATSSAPAVTSSVTSSCCADRALQLSSSDTDLSGPFTVSSKNESHIQSGEESETKCVGRPLDLTADVQAMHIREFQTQHQNELRHTHIHTPQRSTSSLTAPKVSSSGKLGIRTEDIVERNKITLGRDKSKGGSYLKAYGFKQGTAHKEKKVQRTLREIAGAECQEGSSVPKIRFIQKTQQVKLQVPQISKEKKEIPKRSRKPQPPVLRVKAEHEDSVISPIENPTPRTQLTPRKTTPSQQLPPTIHLNVHLNTPADLLPLLQQTGQDAVISLASLHGYTHWNSASEIALYPGYQPTNPGRPTDMPRELEQWQRTATLKWPLSSEVRDPRWSPNEVHTKQFAENFHRTPTPLSQGLGSHTVLPPIGKPTTERRSELSHGEEVNTAYPIHKSNSDGYLVQMEKKKQMTYKAYSLKDYKQLKSDIKLRGLGPDYTATEKTVST